LAKADVRRFVAAACGLLGAVALFAIMLLTLVDVSGRKVLSQSVTGSLELTEMLMVLVIFAGLPLVSLRGEHVVFDSLDTLWPRGFKRVLEGAVDLLCAVAMAGLAWLMWEKAGQMAQYGDITAQLKLPLGPLVSVMSVLCAITALVHVVLAFAPVAHHHIGVDDDVTTGAAT
jgi:TRAP-type transport system small permease protein